MTCNRIFLIWQVWIAEEAQIGVIQPPDGHRFPQLEFGFDTQPSAARQSEVNPEGGSLQLTTTCATCSKERSVSSQGLEDSHKHNSEEQTTTQHSTNTTNSENTSVSCNGLPENPLTNTELEQTSVSLPLQIDIRSR